MASVKYIKVTRKVETHCITSTCDLKVCNKAIIEHTAKMAKVTEGQVEHVLSFIGGYTHGVISRGIMETVMLPYFGKFKPKVKEIKARAATMIYGTRSAKHAILKAIRYEQIKNNEITGSRRKS